MSDERQYNSKLNKHEFNERKLVLKSRPRMVFLELTRTCNLFCSMCRGRIINDKEFFMNDFILDKIRKELFPYVEYFDLRGWGESTLDDRLLDIVKEINNKSVKINLYTNLTTRNEEYWKEIIINNVSLAISIESAREGRYEVFRRGGDFNKLVANLNAIMSVVNEKGLENIPFFTTVVSEENSEDISDIIDLAAKFGIKRVQLNTITKGSGNENDNYPQIGIKIQNNNKLMLDLREIVNHSKRSGVCVEIASNLFTMNDHNWGQCIHPWTYTYIRFDGCVGFCDHLLAHNDSIMGNLNNDSFMDIWNNEKYLDIRSKHLKQDFSHFRKVGIECDWCYGNRYGNCEYLFEKEYSPINILDYLKKIEQ